jgi:hypothetical protein
MSLHGLREPGPPLTQCVGWTVHRKRLSEMVRLVLH